jgi:hypothetical protein
MGERLSMQHVIQTLEATRFFNGNEAVRFFNNADNRSIAGS